jgi:alkanesulfonate monooxygenase SsuD/methylene tetrahydromethanopterin reductase-like flavin-dependent oxidoreductase (luciferase family)
MRLAVRWADEFNLTSAGPDEVGDKLARLVDVCRDAGRDPATLTRSAMIGVLVGRSGDELRARERQLLAALGQEDAGEAWLEARRSRWIMGTPDEARAMARRFAEAGAERIMLQDMLPRDHGMIELAAAELNGKV